MEIGSPEDVRRWVEGHRAAERLQHDLERGRPMPTAEALEQAWRLVAFAAALHGWPPPEDEHDRRENLETWERWALLRRRMLSGCRDR